MTYSGLTSAEVEQRRAEGKSNVNTDIKTRGVRQIFAAHTFTLFNLINLILAILVAFTQSWRNMLFMVVVVLNIGISVFQEIRAKKKVDELAILTRKPVRALRDGAEVELAIEDLVLDDVILIAHGEQIPADSEVLEGDVLVDESLLTGESDSIEKRPGSELFSGSFIVSGNVVARVTRVGAEGYAARISAEAKYMKPVRSEILTALKTVIRLATIALVPLGVGLFLRTMFMDGVSINDAILSTVAAVVGMIPQGLVLLTSSVFAIATTRLASHSVLVQQSYCIETLARVDVLCLDKTGTITSGHMQVEDILPVPSSSKTELARTALSIVTANAGDANETAHAIAENAAHHSAKPFEIARAVPFSSANKFSGCVTADGRSLIMGAAQFVFKPILPEIDALMQNASPMSRILVCGEAAGFDEGGAPLGEVRPIGVVLLRDEIRDNAAETLAFFAEQDVSLRVISGDDPRTVSAIAASVGLAGAENAVDCSQLADDDALVEASRDGIVFGRVTPQQKRTLVRALKAQGHTVAMTGDGVNDVLALKEADCSISVAAGSAAARNVSEIVLADNDFAHMPDVVAEGRRSINNLQRSAALFLVKTVYAAVLAAICILLPPYPFIPIQMSLISSAIIGIPSFVLALEPNHDLVGGHFMANVFSRSLPASAAISGALLAAIIWGRVTGLTFAQVSTLSCLLACLIGIALIITISLPPTPLRVALIAVVTGIVALGLVVFPDYFKFARFSPEILLPFAVIGSVFLVLFIIQYRKSVENFNAGRGLGYAIESWGRQNARDNS